jgi:hypothetical protein
MAWHAGNYTLSPGVSTRIFYWWGDNHGVQYAEPMQLLSNDPPPLGAGSPLKVTAQGTIRNTDGYSVTYFLDVTNEGPGVWNFAIIGFGDIRTGV